MLRSGKYRRALRLACAGSLLGLPCSRAAEPLQPVVARVELMFSLVTHYSHIAERVGLYNNQGSPKGVQNYGVPNLVYEPRVTLYNPHNVELRLNRARIRLSDPPVGFRFKKNSDYLRPEWAAGEYHGIARLNISNQSNPGARKTFTMILGGGDANNYSGEIVLAPGEAKSFGTRVDFNWTWGLETAGGYTPRSFADWYSEKDFSNKDGRTNNAFGAEAVAGTIARPFEPQAGFQTDHLSSSINRPAATLYSFETNPSGWVAIKMTDSVSVSAKVMRTFSGSPTAPDFQFSQLRGNVVDPAADTLKSYDFSAAEVTMANPANGINRTFLAGDILQKPTSLDPEGKSAFANFVITARTNALKSGAFLSGAAVPAQSLYETRLDERVDFFLGPDGRPSDYPRSGVEAFRVERVGDFVMIDLAAPPRSSGWTFHGGSDPGGSFPDDLSAVTTVVEGPRDAGIYKAKIDVSGRGPQYFVRIGF